MLKIEDLTKEERQTFDFNKKWYYSAVEWALIMRFIKGEESLKGEVSQENIKLLKDKINLMKGGYKTK